ncbi:MAG: helix-turn-helix transcriptional regulator [Cyclobacteriaceae bacterium]
MYYNKLNSTVQSEIVKYIWELKIKKGEGESGIYTIPDNYGELILNVGDEITVTTLSSNRKIIVSTGDIVLGNLRSKGIHLQCEGDMIMTGIKIKPGYVNFINTYDTPFVRDSFVKLDAVGPYKAGREVLFEYLTYDQDKQQPDHLLQEAMGFIKESHGEIKVMDLYEPLGIGKSTLEHKFVKDLSITPKEFCKIEKLKRFLYNYHQYQSIYNLTQLAMMSGYYDQSHFIKDFRYFMDMTPSKFLKVHNAQLEILVG